MKEKRMNENRSTTIVIAWLGYLGVIVYLANTLGPVAIPFAAIMMVPLIVMMNFLWGDKKEENLASSAGMSQQEKRKRERIDNMIRDMSDDELYELRRRLQDGGYDDDYLYDRMVGDDGEIVTRR